MIKKNLKVVLQDVFKGLYDATFIVSTPGNFQQYIILHIVCFSASALCP
jgi:hypothetical protein